jgi:hypothetical protein
VGPRLDPFDEAVDAADADTDVFCETVVAGEAEVVVAEEQGIGYPSSDGDLLGLSA